jgi:hypothetical protein
MSVTRNEENVTPVFRWDLERLDQWSAQQGRDCPRCGARLDPAQHEAVVRHLMGHERSPERRAELERALALFRQWDTLPAAVQAAHLAPVIHGLRADPRTFARLRREGVVK